jgi:hypothetical protein
LLRKALIRAGKTSPTAETLGAILNEKGRKRIKMNRFDEEIEKLIKLSYKPYKKQRIEIDINPIVRKNSNHIENMLVLFELKPIFPIGDSCSLDDDILDLRRALSYEIQYKMIKLIKSFISNVNNYNEIGCAISLRSIYEIYYFLTYYIDNHLNSIEFMNKLFIGGQFNKTELFIFNKLWEENHNQENEKEVIELLLKYLKLPHISTYKKYFMNKNELEFDLIYDCLCEYVHPSFGKVRVGNFEENDTENNQNINISPLTSENYYVEERENKHLKQISFFIEATSVILGFLYELFTKIDPIYSKDDIKKILNNLMIRARSETEETIIQLCTEVLKMENNNKNI